MRRMVGCSSSFFKKSKPFSNLAVNIHSGKIETQNINGRLNLTMKYGKGRIGNAGDSQLDLYDCNLTVGNLGNVTITSKYSKLQLGDANRLSADTYDDELTFGRITGPLTITDKYSDVNIKSFASARIDFYDSNLTADEGRDMQVKSKYTKFSIGRLESLAFELSYDDAVTVDQLGSLTADSKYTNFKIGALSSSLALKSYDDQVQIGTLSGPLTGVEFNGKYTDLNLPLPEGQQYRLEAELTYGRLLYPEDRFDSQYYKEKNDHLEMRGHTRGATDDSPLVSIQSYDGKIVLQ